MAREWWLSPDFEPIFKRVPVGLSESEYTQLWHLADSLKLPMSSTLRLGIDVLQDVVKLMTDIHVPLWYLKSSERFTLRTLMGWIEPRKSPEQAKLASAELVPMPAPPPAGPELVRLGPLDDLDKAMAETRERQAAEAARVRVPPVDEWLDEAALVRVLVVASGLVAAGFIVGLFVGYMLFGA